jgi:hypothetical protein
MSAEGRRTPAKDCQIATHGDLALEPVQDQCHHRHLAVAGSSRDEQWARAQQVQQDCRPWGHIRALPLVGLMQEQELLVALETTVSYCDSDLD